MDDEDRRKADDWIDHQAEVAGISNGRASRFLDGEDSPRNRHTNERRARERAFQHQLEQLLLDPACAAAYERVGDAIDTAQDKLNATLENVAARIEHLQDVIRDLEERTAKLPDGTAVFRDSKGNLRRADGDQLSEAETALLIGPENLGSYEQYTETKDALQSARSRQDELSGTQSKIDSAREQRDEATTVEELEALEADMEELTEELQSYESVRSTFNQLAKSAPAEDMELSFDGIGAPLKR